MTRQFAFVTVWLWLWSASFPGIASAGIIGTTGAIMEIAPPPSVELDVLESNSTIFAFTEMIGLSLGKDLAVDITSPGSYSEPGDLTPGLIAAKTVVDVYFLHFDPVTGLVILSGSITFDQDIVGVIVLSDSLDATDRSLGFPGTAYPTGLTTRGLEFGGVNSDFITLSEDLRTISIDRQATTGMDQIRIITAIPAPVANFYTDPAAFEAALQETDKRAKASWNFKPNNLPPASVVSLDDPLNIDTHDLDPDDPWSNPPTGQVKEHTIPVPPAEGVIPDNDPIGVSHEFMVPNSGIIDDLNLDLSITHTWVGDLCVILEKKSGDGAGISVAVIQRPGAIARGDPCHIGFPFGCPEDNYLKILLDDQGAGGAIEDACTTDLTSPPNYVPNNPLSAFNGIDKAGLWSITVIDNAAADTGTLTQWSLHFLASGTEPVNKWPPSLDNVTFQANLGPNPQPPLPNPHTPNFPGEAGLAFASDGFADNDNNILVANFFVDSFDILSGPPTGGPPPSGDCCVAHPTSGCEDLDCETAICAIDPFCCDIEWDDTCAASAALDPNCDCATVPLDNHTAMSMEIIAADGGVGPILVTVYDKNEVPFGTIELNNPPPPPNNECADRELIEQDVLTLFDTSEATTDGPSPCGLLGDIWYNFTPAQTLVYDISLCGSSYDTVLAVYDGCACPADPANEIACNDDFCGLQSQVKVHLAGGQCYKIQVGGFSTDAGLGQILITKQNPTGCDDPLSGDCCIANGTPGCDRKECCVAICAIDPFCCDTAWTASAPARLWPTRSTARSACCRPTRRRATIRIPVTAANPTGRLDATARIAAWRSVRMMRSAATTHGTASAPTRLQATPPARSASSRLESPGIQSPALEATPIEAPRVKPRVKMPWPTERPERPPWAANERSPPRPSAAEPSRPKRPLCERPLGERPPCERPPRAQPSPTEPVRAESRARPGSCSWGSS